MGNKQELEAIVLLESYDLVAITATRWDESCGWSAAVDGYRLFRRYRVGRSGGGVSLCIDRWIKCEELSLKKSQGQVQLWISCIILSHMQCSGAGSGEPFWGQLMGPDTPSATPHLTFQGEGFCS